MTNENQARVIRAYSLPVAAFDHLKGNQRLYQCQATREGEDRTVTNSEALTRILEEHYNLGLVAAFRGMHVGELCRGLASGRLEVSLPNETAGGRNVATL
jgi:hypothetical protein